MSYTLHAQPGSFRAFPILIAAEYNDINVEIAEPFDVKVLATKSPTGKGPILETPSGKVLFSSHAIARYMANLRRDTTIAGSSALEQAQIDSWLDFCAAELELPACVWFYPIAGYMPFYQEAYEKAKADFAKALQVLESHLEKGEQKYLVGDSLTLADIVVVSTLLYPFKLTASPSYLKAFPKVVAWFESCSSQKEFVNVVGVTTLCKEELLAEGCTKSADEVAAAPSSRGGVDLAAFKSSYQPSEATMTKFWDEVYDPTQFSIWKCVYDYPDDNENLDATKEIVTEFMKKSQPLSQDCFGVMHVTEKLEIEGLWLFRGDDPEAMFGCNEDTSWFTWSRVGPDPSDSVKAAVAESWAKKAGDGAIRETQVFT
mmetsp:Transcript_27904/g.42251  ORF Transcript_27904/g.42251 Transcript_27904/m.42251 type:complete len:372 (-) Transcript_27904:66-1181(-)